MSYLLLQNGQRLTLQPGGGRLLLQDDEDTRNFLVQHLNFVISQSYDALLAAGDGDGRNGANRDEDSGVLWVDDPSTSNGPATTMGPGVGGSAPGGDGSTGGTPGPRRPTLPPGTVRRVRPGGSGVQPNRRRPAPAIRLTITADDQTKDVGQVFEWNGDEFTDTGLQ